MSVAVPGPGPSSAGAEPPRAGLGALSDLETPRWRELLRALAEDQRSFLAREGEFRSPEYQWPRDALHWWSRVWEYPYAFEQLRHFRARSASARNLAVADVGSGVTFFPSSVARLGYDVLCLDVDPVCARDMGRAARAVPAAPGSVSTRLITGPSLPLGTGELDAVYCISVLEHIPDFAGTVREMARTLRRGGLLVLTLDLDLTGRERLGVRDLAELRAALDEHFDLLVPERTVHPSDILRSDNGPHPWIQRRSPLARAAREVKQVVRKIRGRPPRVDPELAVCGLTLGKR